MRKISLSYIGILVILLALVLSGCSKSEEYVETVTTQDENESAVTNTNNGADTNVPNGAPGMNTVTGDYEIPGDELPMELQGMVPLCDAISQVMVETARPYSSTDAHVIWKSLKIAFIQSEWKKEGIIENSLHLYVPHDKVTNYAYAMFGQLTTIPNIPDDMIESKECIYATSPIGGEICECFHIGDEGLSTIKVQKAVMHNDATVEMTVLLETIEDNSEIASFVVYMRPNSQNISKSAKFQYEIVDVKNADELTSKRMSKVPYIVPLMQQYLQDCIEILTFACFGEGNPSIKLLQERIMSDLVKPLKSEGEGYDDILAYPVTNSGYVQIVSVVRYREEDSSEVKVYTYNYDVRGRDNISNEEALTYAHISEDELISKVSAACEENDSIGPVDNIDYCGFLIGEDDTVDFYLLISSQDEDGLKKSIAGYSPSDNHLVIYEEGEDIVDASIVDKMTSELTHGRDI